MLQMITHRPALALPVASSLKRKQAPSRCAASRDGLWRRPISTKRRLRRTWQICSLSIASENGAKGDVAHIARIKGPIRMCVSAAKETLTISSKSDIRNETSVAAIPYCRLRDRALWHLWPRYWSRLWQGHIRLCQSGNLLPWPGEHVGPTAGKAPSIDVVKYAKDALNAPGEKIHCQVFI